MIFTGRNEVVAKVMFLHVSVILLTGGGLQAGRPPQNRQTPSGPGRETPPRNRQTPPDQAGRPPPDQAGRTPPPDQAGRPPPRTRQTTPSPPGSRLQHTVNERLVRILLECILVFNSITNILVETLFMFFSVQVRLVLFVCLLLHIYFISFFAAKNRSLVPLRITRTSGRTQRALAERTRGS